MHTVCLVWLGLAWFGLVWLGLVWFGLVRWLVGFSVYLSVCFSVCLSACLFCLFVVWFGLVWFGLFVLYFVMVLPPFQAIAAAFTSAASAVSAAISLLHTESPDPPFPPSLMQCPDPREMQRYLEQEGVRATVQVRLPFPFKQLKFLAFFHTNTHHTSVRNTRHTHTHHTSVAESPARHPPPPPTRSCHFVCFVGCCCLGSHQRLVEKLVLYQPDDPVQYMIDTLEREVEVDVL